LGSTVDYIPAVTYVTWLYNFLMWNLFFTVAPIMQYAVLNASHNSYKRRKKEIGEMIAEMMAIASKFDELREEPGELLAESRKKI
jgi:hypothetical protein